MDSFWKGAFSPPMQKHRDYEHATFFEHEMDNGGFYSVDQLPVKVKINPVTENLLDPPQDYHFVDFTLHDKNEYTFLVPTESDGSEPEEKRIKDTVNAYVRNKVSGGRDWLNYVDTDIEEQHPRVQERLEAGDVPENPNLDRKSKTFFWGDEGING